MRVVGDWIDDELKLRAIRWRFAVRAGAGRMKLAVDPAPSSDRVQLSREQGLGHVWSRRAQNQEVEIELANRVRVTLD